MRMRIYWRVGVACDDLIQTVIQILSSEAKGLVYTDYTIQYSIFTTIKPIEQNSLPEITWIHPFASYTSYHILLSLLLNSFVRSSGLDLSRSRVDSKQILAA